MGKLNDQTMVQMTANEKCLRDGEAAVAGEKASLEASLAVLMKK